MDTIIPLTPTDTPTKGPIREFFSRTKRVFFDPAKFFQLDLSRMNFSEALTFGLLHSWLASILSFFFDTMNSFLITRFFERWVQRLLASEDGIAFMDMTSKSFLWTAGLLLLHPFLVLLRVLFGSMAIYVFAKLLIEEEEEGRPELSYSAVAKIQAVCFTSQWLSIVPLFGTVLAFLVHLILLVTGIREQFRVSTRRAVAVVFAPYVILLVLALFTFLVFLVALFQFPFHEFLDMEVGSLRSF